MQEIMMAGLLPNVDPDGLLEYSVVYTDRSLNHMSESFQKVMRDISKSLKEVYHAKSVVVIPGSGTFGMEAVARQFATGKHCFIVRNGWFSFRWTQIFETGNIPSKTTVFKAQKNEEKFQASYSPAPIEEVVAAIIGDKPDLVFATHVETAAGLMLPNSYLKKLSDAIHSVGGMLVLDCIASGAMWVDMSQIGVDILISAPQKGWSSSPCCGLVLMNDIAREKIDSTTSTSFACDLRKWMQIMESYEKGMHAYHATMPTDGLSAFRDMIKDFESFGFDKARSRQEELGRKVRAILKKKGVKDIAAAGFQAPGVIVSYTEDSDIHNGKKFAKLGIQVAAGVPLQCDESPDFKTFRIGLFGLDKLQDVDGAVARLESTLNDLF